MPLDASLSERLPTVEEAEKTKRVITALVRQTDKRGALFLRLKQNAKDTPVELPPAVSRLVLDLLLLISRREAVTLVPVGAELSTQQAADMLNVSRPFLVKLLKGKEIPYYKVGSHRRIRADDLFAYKRKRDRSRDETLSRLAELGQEIDAE